MDVVLKLIITVLILQIKHSLQLPNFFLTEEFYLSESNMHKTIWA